MAVLTQNSEKCQLVFQTLVVVLNGYGILHGGYRSGGKEMRRERTQTQEIIIKTLSSVLLIMIMKDKVCLSKQIYTNRNLI